MMALFCGCGSNSETPAAPTVVGSQTLTAGQTLIATIPNGSGAFCDKNSRTTSTCASARQALGLTGNWLNFSCNLQLGLVTSTGSITTDYAAASFISITFVNLPDHTSNYYSTTGNYSFSANGITIGGTFSSLYKMYTPSFPDPGLIAQKNVVMKVPKTPTLAGNQTMAGGMVGVTVNGVGIFDTLAASTDNIFAEVGSFDPCQGHPAGTTYHYHSEPYSISYDDNNLIGVMRDGFFIYGRQDYNGTVPGSTANIQSQGAASTIYKYGGHSGTDPISNTGTTFHYHLTQWEGCFHESGTTKFSDDGSTNDTINSGTPSCGGSWITTWSPTGHGNGGVFSTVPTGIGTQAPSQTLPGIRYYYGTPGTCIGC